MEDTASSQPSCITRPASMSSAGERSWPAVHLAGFLQAPAHADNEDDSLQDTACSSAARPEAAGYFVDASSRRQATAAVQQVIGGGDGTDNQLHGCNDLRKRGLCLVPLSLLIDYLG